MLQAHHWLAPSIVQWQLYFQSAMFYLLKIFFKHFSPSQESAVFYFSLTIRALYVDRTCALRRSLVTKRCRAATGRWCVARSPARRCASCAATSCAASTRRAPATDTTVTGHCIIFDIRSDLKLFINIFIILCARYNLCYVDFCSNKAWKWPSTICVFFFAMCFTTCSCAFIYTCGGYAELK